MPISAELKAIRDAQKAKLPARGAPVRLSVDVTRGEYEDFRKAVYTRGDRSMRNVLQRLVSLYMEGAIRFQETVQVGGETKVFKTTSVGATIPGSSPSRMTEEYHAQMEKVRLEARLKEINKYPLTEEDEWRFHDRYMYYNPYKEYDPNNPADVADMAEFIAFITDPHDEVEDQECNRKILCDPQLLWDLIPKRLPGHRMSMRWTERTEETVQKRSKEEYDRLLAQRKTEVPRRVRPVGGVPQQPAK